MAGRSPAYTRLRAHTPPGREDRPGSRCAARRPHPASGGPSREPKRSVSVSDLSTRLWCGLTYLELLAGVVAGVGLVEDDDVQPAVLAVVVVAAGAPVLPLPHLVAAPLLPHLLGVVETPAAAAVTLQGEVTVLACKDSQSW